MEAVGVGGGLLGIPSCQFAVVHISGSVPVSLSAESIILLVGHEAKLPSMKGGGRGALREMVRIKTLGNKIH